MFCHRRLGFLTRQTDRASTVVTEFLSGQTHSEDADNLRTRPTMHRNNDHPDLQRTLQMTGGNIFHGALR